MEISINRYAELIKLFRTHIQELHYYEVSKESDVSTLYFLKKSIRNISNEMRTIERILGN